jgi:hypothetical protein
MKNEFDLEPYELVSELNETAGRVVSRIVENVDDAFARITSLLPRMNRKGDVDWNKSVIDSEPVSATLESTSEQHFRIISDFRGFLRLGQLTDLDWITFLSDDFYSKGIECEASQGILILEKWLLLPHGVFIVANNGNALHVVMFARTSYVFLNPDIPFHKSP